MKKQIICTEEKKLYFIRVVFRYRYQEKYS